MRYRLVTTSLLSATLFIMNARAQTGDWRNVQGIPSGSEISVKGPRHRVGCIFQRATDDKLFCERHKPPRYGTGDQDSRDIDFDRQEVREVRLERSSALLGAVIGAGIGAGIGVAVSKSQDIESKVYTPIGGVVVGAFAGAIIGQLPIRHGKVVYQVQISPSSRLFSTLFQAARRATTEQSPGSSSVPLASKIEKSSTL